MPTWSGDHFGLSAQLSRKLNAFRSRYENMPTDAHLFQGEGERFRRYARFLIDPKERTLKIFEHDSFFQAKKFDQLYGDIHRKFAPLAEEDFDNDFLQMLIIESFHALPVPIGIKFEEFEISAHMIRIESTPSSTIGRPAPEGIHRDGYHYGSIHLMRRENLQGAENNIYDLDKRHLHTLKLEEPMDTIYFDDAAIFHGVTPFTRLNEASRGTRDILILLYQPLRESPQRRTRSRLLRRY